MQAILKDAHEGICYPFTVFANLPVCANNENVIEEEALRQWLCSLYPSLLRSDFKVCFLGSNAGDWSDDMLLNIGDGEGMMIVFAADADFKISKLFSPEDVAKLRISGNIGALLFAYCMMAADVSEPKINEELNTNQFHSMPESSSEVLNEIVRLEQEHCLYHSDKLSLFLFKGSASPAVMQLIGRARAVTFAAIGAGSGQEVDITDEDAYYDHLMLWDKVNQCLVGAYRIGFIQEIIESHGAAGIYLDHIFEFQSEFYEKIGNAMELSRSFILPEYQKNPQMLDMLWKGIGLTAIAKNCYTLYGSVTISASFTPLSQAIIVDTLDRYHSEDAELRKLVAAKQPFIPITIEHRTIAEEWSGKGVNKLNTIIQELEADQRSIPPLIRYYISLGAKFLAFQVEKSFNNAIYCLLKVDLKSLPPRYKKRFLGE